MDVFKFVKLANKANDPLRRYAVVCGTARVGDLEVLPPKDDSVVLTAEFKPELSDAARKDALNTALRFLDELALGWGVHLSEDGSEGEERPDGSFRSRVTFRTG